MRLITYLTERSVMIDSELARQTIKDKCGEALEAYIRTGNYMFRGNRALKSDYARIGAMEGEHRASRNTSNHYTLIINSHPRWEAYPKRDIICTNYFARGVNYSSFNGCYLMFPYDGAKIGICEESDIWSSFRGVANARQFNEALDDGLGISANGTYADLEGQCRQFDMTAAKWYSRDGLDYDAIVVIKRWYEANERNDMMYTLANNIFSPMGFKIGRVSGIPNNGKGMNEKEMWFDKGGIMMKVTVMQYKEGLKGILEAI